MQNRQAVLSDASGHPDEAKRCQKFLHQYVISISMGVGLAHSLLYSILNLLILKVIPNLTLPLIFFQASFPEASGALSPFLQCDSSAVIHNGAGHILLRGSPDKVSLRAKQFDPSECNPLRWNVHGIG